MKYKEYKCNSYNVYTVKTNRFKTSHIELIFRGEVKKDLLPELVFLADVLSESSKNYPSKRSLMIRFEELYKISCYATSLRIGSTMDFHVSLDLINPKYINDADYLENAIKTLFEIVLNPNVENEEFDTAIFNNVKTRLYREIKSLEENDMKQSIKKAFKLMDSDSITSYDLLGTKEQLDEITPASLYKTYKNLLKNFSSDIFAIGDMDMDSLVKLIKKYYKNRYINEFTYNYYVDNKVRNSVKKGEEIGSSVQANLVMLFNLDNLEKRERDITMHVFNYLFGSGGLTSKLYRSIREKYSLCYNINSLYLKYDKLLLVHTSLENENVLKAINLAKKDFKSMQHGEFTTEELNDAISNMLVSIDMSSDNNISIINNYVFKVYDNLPDLDERKKLFKEVTKSDVINVAKKIKLNTIFVLKGKGSSMEEIELIGIDEKIYYYKTSSGLRIYMWVNKNVKSMESCLCVKYGSIDTKFKVGKKTYEVPNGIAHFLEHVKFNVSDGVTAHDIFYKLGADSNAFTTFEYTNYYCFTTENKGKVVCELLNFVYNPFFTKKLIEKEKGIIVEEAKMGIDNSNTLMYFNSLKSALVKSKYRNTITGTPDDVLKISLDDVCLVYDTFYHPENMFMVVTGSFNPYEIASVVEENLNEKEFLEYKNPLVIMNQEPKKVAKKYSEDVINIGSTCVKMFIKMDLKRFKDYNLLELSYITDIIFAINIGKTSEFREKLINDGVVTTLGFDVNYYGDVFSVIISANTNFKNEFIKRINDKLNNLYVDEIDFLRKKNANLATYILEYEDIDNISLKIQDNIINFNKLITNEKEIIEKLSIDDANRVLELFDFSNISVNVFKPKKNQD